MHTEPSEVAAIDRVKGAAFDYPELARITQGLGVEYLEDAEEQAERDLLITAAGTVSALVGDAAPPPGADEVLKRLSEYEETHDSIGDRLLGWLIARDPAKAMDALETINGHLDQRMVRSVAAPASEATTDDGAPA